MATPGCSDLEEDVLSWLAEWDCSVLSGLHHQQSDTKDPSGQNLKRQHIFHTSWTSVWCSSLTLFCVPSFSSSVLCIFLKPMQFVPALDVSKTWRQYSVHLIHILSLCGSPDVWVSWYGAAISRLCCLSCHSKSSCPPAVQINPDFLHEHCPCTKAKLWTHSGWRCAGLLFCLLFSSVTE